VSYSASGSTSLRDGGIRIDRLAGAELGGIPLVTAASLETGLPCWFVPNKKKDYGTAKQLEGVLNKGDGIVIVEDVATTGVGRPSKPPEC
jgi:orotate phosphoribosyltransferase